MQVDFLDTIYIKCRSGSMISITIGADWLERKTFRFITCNNDNHRFKLKYWFTNPRKCLTEKSSMIIAIKLRNLCYAESKPIISQYHKYFICTELYCIDKHLLVKQLVSQHLITDLFCMLFWMM